MFIINYVIVYTPIVRDGTWRFSLAFASSTWKDYSFDDSSWTNMNLSNPGTVEGGNHFFRISFTGNSNLVALELALRYQYGIAAYINGEEIFRDNLPDGNVSFDQVATGSYSSLDYHYIIRSSSYAPSELRVLAVEYHFSSQAVSSVVGFNGWMAMYASSIPDKSN